jgi:hypothetical protein
MPKKIFFLIAPAQNAMSEKNNGIDNHIKLYFMRWPLLLTQTFQ